MLREAFVSADVDASALEALCGNAATAMSASIGVDFAMHVGLIPTFLQPLFLILLLQDASGNIAEARVLICGFVAAKPKHITGDRPDAKCTNWCAWF
ncbi:unnamed protein product [Polarella glacialis]|uniref:Uncharacterized protein n=1 Tax=Polarella glacialis TaxID=89957 RepID=A0A813DNH4_POLGL|nr:unnamed protein product [Polarella glacialis]